MADANVLENEFLRLDVTTAPAAGIRLTDKRSGFVWECPGAPFALHYWEAPHLAVRTCPADPGHGWEFRLLPDEDTLSLQCTWPRAACGFRAVFRLDGPALTVAILGRRLVENRQFHVRQMAIDVLWRFGAAPTGEDGFLFIPRERGVLCRFNETAEHETELLFYADSERSLTAPVFGAVRGTAGFLGIVAEQEFNAAVVLGANQGPAHNLNAVSPRFKLRFQSGDALEDADSEVRYVFLNGADASVVGMAKTYRTYLTEKRGVPLLQKRVELRPALAYAEGALTIHVHLAEKRRTTSMSGEGELRVKTRFDEVVQIAEAIRNCGINRASIVLVGWNCEGRDGLYPTRFPVESAVGGADAMARALAAVTALGFQVGALDNYTDMYRRSPAFNKDLGAEQPGGEPWRGGVWAGGQSHVVCPRQARDRHVQRDMRRLRDLGLDGMLFLDHFPGPGVLRCYHPEHPLTRAEYAQNLREIVRLAQGTFGLCRISGAAVFAALESDTCMLPLQDVPGVDSVDSHWCVEEPVPFLPIALHGLVLLASEAAADPLRAIEYGAAPVYHTSTAEFSHALEEMNAFYRRYVASIAPLAWQLIESHEVSPGGLIRVGYANGAEVLINRTAQPAEIAGVPVGPKDFQVKQ